MPELPEVETVKTALEGSITGAVIRLVQVSAKPMRFPIPPNLPQMIEGGVITGVRRRGKYILLDIAFPPPNSAKVMLIHLGMSGSIRLDDAMEKKHDHLIIEMRDGDMADGWRLTLNDPRRFGGVDLFDRAFEPHHRLLKNLGIDPLSNRFDGAFLKEALAGKIAPIKTALLDQRIIAGIGNIYASEALFDAGINPKTKAGRIATPRLNRLSASIRSVLARAIKAGGTSLKDHIQPNGAIGYFAIELAVYGRDNMPCHHCGRVIRKITQANRASFYCPHCQS